MSQISQVKEATDIVQIIGERLALQRSGSSYRALCPFHSEKSPSFFVNEQFQSFRCFGCGEHGDVFTFLEKYEGMTFGEALKTLADRAGITLESYQPSSEEDAKIQLLGVLNLAKEYYHFLLTKHEVGESARQYLKDRGVTQESIRLFQLGYALPSWDGLLKYLRDKKKYPEELIEKAGLVISGKTGRKYDRFRDRIMFPLANHRGQIVGFSGRVLDPQAKEAKYINTPETLLYHKSQMLYGYSELYQEIRKKKEVVVVEGEFDVISSAQAHINYVVAIKGSALTTEHLKLLGRSVEKVLLSLDADSAGIEATRRAIILAKDTNLELRVVNLRAADGQKQDPDDVARHQPAAWREAVKSSISVYEFLLQAALHQFDAKTPEGKRQIMTELGPVLNSISLVVEQDVYIKKLAQALQVREELIRTDLASLSRKAALQPPRPRRSNDDTTAVDKKTGDEGSASPRPEATDTRLAKFERYALFLLFRMPEDKWQAKAQQLGDREWVTVGAKQLLAALQAQKAPQLARFAQSLPEDLHDLLFGIYLDPVFAQNIETLDIDQEWTNTVKELKLTSLHAEISRVEAELNHLDHQETKTPIEEQRQNELLQRLVGLQQRITKL